MNSQPPFSQTAIIEVENQLLEAIKISDVRILDALLHDDLLFITPTGQPVTKAMDLDSHRSGTMVVEEIRPEIETIHLIEDTAVVIVVYQTKGKMMGTPLEGRFRYIRVWRWFGTSWKVIGGSCTPVPTENRGEPS